MRRAGRPITIATAAVTAPPKSRSSGQRHRIAEVRRHERPHGDEAELPQGHLPGPTGEDGERQRDDGVDADLAEQVGAARRRGRTGAGRPGPASAHTPDTETRLAQAVAWCAPASPARPRTTSTRSRRCACPCAWRATRTRRTTRISDVEDRHVNGRRVGRTTARPTAAARRRSLSPIPATKATVRLTMAPISAAVRANSSRSGLSAWASALVWPGALRIALKADKRAGHRPGQRRGAAHPHPREPGRVGVLGHGAHGQAPVGRADGHLPTRWRRWAPRSWSTPGAGVKISRPDGERQVEGHGHGLEQVLRPVDEGQRREGQEDLAEADRGHHEVVLWRGRSRRRSTSSDSAPTPAASPMESTSENQYSKWKSAVSLTRNTAAMTPTWPWAKLMMRLVR